LLVEDVVLDCESFTITPKTWKTPSAETKFVEVSAWAGGLDRWARGQGYDRVGPGG
jgi:hypothetical protein